MIPILLIEPDESRRAAYVGRIQAALPNAGITAWADSKNISAWCNNNNGLVLAGGEAVHAFLRVMLENYNEAQTAVMNDVAHIRLLLSELTTGQRDIKERQDTLYHVVAGDLKTGQKGLVQRMDRTEIVIAILAVIGGAAATAVVARVFG